MSQILKTEGISAVTFSDIKAGNEFMAKILDTVASAGINIDMISQTPPKSDRISFGFSFNDSDITNILTTVKNAVSGSNVTPLVNSGNVKVTVKSEEMKNQAGFAAKVFNAARQIGAEILLVTTSIDEISLLVNNSYADELAEKLQNI